MKKKRRNVIRLFMEIIVKEKKKLNMIAQSLGIIYKVLASLMSAALSYLVNEVMMRIPNRGRILRRSRAGPHVHSNSLIIL